MKGNFTRLQAYSSIFSKRYSPPHSGSLYSSFIGWKRSKNSPQTLKTKPEEILSVSFPCSSSLPKHGPGWIAPDRFLPRPAEAGRKLGAARSASSPAVCVRVHAHVSPAPGLGTGTAPGTISPTALLWGLAGLGEGGDASAAPLTPG